MTSSNPHTSEAKPTRPVSRVMFSRIRNLNPAISLRRSASKPLTSLHNRGTPSREAPNRGRPNPSQTSLITDQSTLKKATFQWVKGDLLGRGSYAQVYLGLNATTGEIMAVKQVELSQTSADQSNSRHREIIGALDSERKTLMDLDHINIVQYLGYEESPKHLSIFLEYVPGGTISSCLRKDGGGFNEEVTKSFTSQILAGLEYLHSKGILHRDLKSDNILVEPTGVCKIADFGISKKAANIFRGRAFTAMKGTIYWMAPEVVDPDKKEGYDVKVDIWSVGCIVLEMWTGERPWHGEELYPVMLKLFRQKLPPPIPPHLILSDEASDFRHQCFETNPHDRPSARELQKHSYLILPPSWRFEPSEMQRSPLRHPSPRATRKSRRSFKSIRQLMSSLEETSLSRPLVPPIPKTMETYTFQRSKEMHPSVMSTDRRDHSPKSAEQNSGPPIVYITPPNSPPPDGPRVTDTSSKTSDELFDSVRWTSRKGFRVINPDPEPDPDRVFIYNPPPLPSINSESPYSAQLSPPSYIGIFDNAYPGSSHTYASLLDEPWQIPKGSKTTFINHIDSRRGSSSRYSNHPEAVSSIYSSNYESDSDDEAIWKIPPMDLAETDTWSPIQNSRYRNSKAMGRLSAHNHDPLDRPNPDEVYDHLQRFFPDCDLDKAVVTFSAVDLSNADVEDRNKRVKKSIRMVAEEQSNRIHLGMRRRTKLWDSKVEEIRM